MDTINKKITVTSTFPIYPPKGGGQIRVYNLYKNIAKYYNVDIVSFTEYNQKTYIGDISSNIKEIRIPKSHIHSQKQWEIEKYIGIPINDVAMIKFSNYTSNYGEYLKKSIETSDIVINSHPYLLYEVKKYIENKPMIYEAQDVEYIIKSQMYSDNKYSREILKWVYEIEKECCEKSEIIMTCSVEDKIKLSELYNITLDKIIVVPNGVDTNVVKYIDINERKKIKQRLGLNDYKIGVFIGSWHPPNLKACEYIFEIAARNPKIIYIIIGSQCMHFRGKYIPQNIRLIEYADEYEKENIYSYADFALNPMTSGSGTNLKMFDYMASGIPIITTEFGARGIEKKDSFIVTNLDNMYTEIENLLNNYNVDNMVCKARTYVENLYDWSKISQALLSRINELKVTI